MATAIAVMPIAARAETLAEAFASAYQSNPVLAAARARQEALEEAPEQARAGGRLTAAVDGGAGYDRFDYGKGGGATVSANLPIWTGGRVSSAVRAAKGDAAAGAEGLRDTEAMVLSAVVSAYAELLYDQQAVAIAQADIKLLDTQVAESQSRFNLGQATKTDVARLQAQQASAVSSLAAAEATLASSTADYRAVVGHDPGQLTPQSVVPGTLPSTLDVARDQVLARNPLYRRSQAAGVAAAARVDQARANGAPFLSVAGAYGYDANLDDGASHGFPRASSIGLALHVPLLTGGLVASQVRQASAERRAAQFDITAAERQALREAETAWANLIGAQHRVSANHAGVAAADLALNGVRAEYGYDLRTTLDILVADESLRGSQLALARSDSDVLIAQAALLRATGQLGR
ncbi:MAG: TolC family outer membrane protein [Pseudomonadota bacterium]|nr:TolC family outer membrane protein [Pseudomonadota bacterium]